MDLAPAEHTRRRKKHGKSRAVPKVRASVQAVQAVLDLRPNECRWPVGDPADHMFHFCRAPRMPGRSYCDYHDSKASDGTPAVNVSPRLLAA